MCYSSFDLNNSTFYSSFNIKLKKFLYLNFFFKKKMVGYPFYVSDETDITAKLAMVASKLALDLDLGSLYSSYSYVDQLLTVDFSSALDNFQEDTLINIVNIIVFGSVVDYDVYVVDYNNFNRRSFSATSAPGAEHDSNLGYSVGSMAILTDGNVYVCVDNSSGAAVWTQLSPAEAAREISISKSEIKKITSPTVPVYMSLTDNLGKPLEVVSGWISGAANWQSLKTFVVDGMYRHMKVITKAYAGGKVRVTLAGTPKAKVLLETSGAASTGVNPMNTMISNINLRGISTLTLEGLGSGTGVYAVYLW